MEIVGKKISKTVLAKQHFIQLSANLRDKKYLNISLEKHE